MLLEEFLKPMGLSRRGLAPRDPPAVFWLSLQHRWDLYWAEKAEASELERIEPVRESSPPARTVKR